MGVIDLTGFGDVLRVIGLLYWALGIVLLYLAATKPKTRLSKGLFIVGVLAVFGYLPVTATWENQQAKKAYEERFAKAESLFKAHCKNAGVKIHRTVEGVEGVYLMKVRTSFNTENQYVMDDPYGIDSTGDDYMKSFISRLGRNNHADPISGSLLGYKYVEADDPADGKLKRFMGRTEGALRIEASRQVDTRNFVLVREPIAQRTARYGVTYDDLSTKEDRDYWIAGSSLRVVDLETSEVIAERIGYMMDPAQGAGGRSWRQAWAYARDNACPAFVKEGSQANFLYQTRLFIAQVLKIKE